MLLHGLSGSWRVWRPVLAALKAEHEVYALTLPGHHAGPVLESVASVSIGQLADAVERLLDDHGLDTAHLAGNSLGGWLAIELGRRGRARSVVALSPAGGWRRRRDIRRVIRLVSTSRAALQRAQAIGLEPLLRRPRLRRLAFRLVMEHAERLSPAELSLLVEDSLDCAAFDGFLAWVRGARPIAPASRRADHPVRIAWPRQDRTIPFGRYGQPIIDAIPEAERVTLDGVGHVPMFDDPGLIARTILEVTRRVDDQRRPLSPVPAEC